jgi:hypothetical protein
LIPSELEDRLHGGSACSPRLADADAVIGALVTTFDLDDRALAHHSTGTSLGLVAQYLKLAGVHGRIARHALGTAPTAGGGAVPRRVQGSLLSRHLPDDQAALGDLLPDLFELLLVSFLLAKLLRAGHLCAPVVGVPTGTRTSWSVRRWYSEYRRWDSHSATRKTRLRVPRRGAAS